MIFQFTYRLYSAKHKAMTCSRHLHCKGCISLRPSHWKGILMVFVSPFSTPNEIFIVWVTLQGLFANSEPRLSEESRFHRIYVCIAFWPYLIERLRVIQFRGKWLKCVFVVRIQNLMISDCRLIASSLQDPSTTLGWRVFISECR